MALCDLALVHNALLGDRPPDDTEKFRSRVRLPIVLSFTDAVFTCSNQGRDGTVSFSSPGTRQRMETVLPRLLAHSPLSCHGGPVRKTCEWHLLSLVPSTVPSTDASAFSPHHSGNSKKV